MSKKEQVNIPEPESVETPKEIIYLYDDGKFERFTPKK